MADLQKKSANIITGKIDNSVIYSNGVVSATNEYTTFYAPVTAGLEYSFAYTSSDVDSAYVYGFFAALPTMGSTTYNNSRTVKNYAQNPTITVTIPDACTYIGIRIPNTALAQGKDVMLNDGSSVLPYEPHTSTGWQHSLRKLTTATEAVENPLYSDGTAITAYTIKGNTIQNGTPTPSAPISVQGVGNKTANLWNEDYTGISDTVTYKPVYVGDGQFTMSNSAPRTSDLAALLFLLAGNVSSGANSSANGVWDEQPRTVTSIDGYVTVAYRTVRTYTPVGSQTMLNTGPTAKPYEPYGYKIPISSGGVTTNIYLGSTQTVRRIKKLVLTGQEDWRRFSTTDDYYFYPGNLMLPKSQLIATHYTYATSRGTAINNSVFTNTGGGENIWIRADAFEGDVSALKTYLQQQYAAGTPVIIWYVLATAETAAVNEPLMKIGAYADTLSNATSIPTTEGANSITVDTTVQPSEFTATWTGWHNANVKEWDGSDWQ